MKKQRPQFPTVSVFSFGAGVQSTTILVLAARREIPAPDYCVFSDPGAESPETIAHLERCKHFAEEAGLRLVHLKPGDLGDDLLRDPKTFTSVPLFTTNEKGEPSGMLPRRCTKDYKIQPIETFIRRDVLALPKRKMIPRNVLIESWLGISEDEEHRAKPPGLSVTRLRVVGKDSDGNPVKAKVTAWEPFRWLEKTYPLLGYRQRGDRSKVPDKRFTFCAGWDREDCLEYLDKHWGAQVPKSACYFCPYRSGREWADMKANRPDEWARAVAWDEAIREEYKDGLRSIRGHLRGRVFVHPSRKPLRDAPLGGEAPRLGCGAKSDEEPDGICGV